ncbi:MAG: transcription elongation factor GreA [Erysipelotrichaceae bacterium]|nr:transcription elongation factor GreA [Erysipelotrichaceae bacterium]MBQ1299581.1 transcription elongation factor GreA [Erysipelotrichaceae bacterium]MBQ1304289.1 transcription elongation factor GreA [Erysipelotrichaceae bacterium]MBQ1758025.1 transcription elongation factor GreA [Erysipelotrichaceae bacterium]MBQ2213998.1 transcription elongation factor GreA [Erysipelotrichaceae bacterium]
MEDNKVVVTKEGLAELQKEYEYLVHVERDQVIEELRAARAQGDLSENADYDAARDHQARVEARIRQLDDMLKNIVLIDGRKGRSKTVRLGSTVTLEFQDTMERETYTIVGTVESDPINGKLSNETPLAVAIMDHKVNDVVPVLVTPAYNVKIVEVK